MIESQVKEKIIKYAHRKDEQKMVQQIGKYNVSYEGKSWNGSVPYEMIIIQEFNGNKPVGNHKCFYIRTKNLLTPPFFKTEQEVEELMKFPEYTRFVFRLMLGVDKEV